MIRRAGQSAGYGRGAQAFHWLSVAMLAVLVAIGLISSSLGDGPRRTWLLDGWHKPLGLLVIAITLARLAWKATQPAVAPAEGLARWEAAASRAMHWALYAMLLAMPLSGLLMSQGAGRPTSFFGLFHIPQMLPIDPALKPRQQHWYRVGKSLHTLWLEWTLYGLVAVHFAGAIKHQFADRAYLRRIWGK